MFQTYCRAVVLRPLSIGDGEHTAQDGVFAQILVGSSASGDALDVDGWTENHIFAT